MRVLVAVACAVLAGATLLSQGTANLRFVEPTADTLVSGPTILRVELDGEGLAGAERVTFFADGQQVCVTPGARPLCEWDAGARLMEHVLRAVASFPDGSRYIANVRTRDPGFTETTSVNIVQVNAFVTEDGRFVPGLTADAFELLDDGEAQPITSFQGLDQPLEVVLVLDISSSMRDVLADMQSAARAFVAALDPDDRVLPLAFNDEVFTLASRATAPEALETINGLSAFGGTALYDALAQALDEVAQTPGRRAVVLFSDGNDESSSSSLDDVQARILRSDAVLFAVGLGQGNEIEALRQTLEGLAEVSGGRAIFADRVDRLDAAFAQIVEDLSNQYTLGFVPRRDGQYHRIDVRVPDSNYRIRARVGYTAPAP